MARKKAQERQEKINDQNKNITAHREVNKFEIPINIIVNITEETDVQTNHRFFWGNEIRQQATKKAEQRNKSVIRGSNNKNQKHLDKQTGEKQDTKHKDNTKETGKHKEHVTETPELNKYDQQKEFNGNNKRRKTDEEQKRRPQDQWIQQRQYGSGRK
jgi:hypothetical protein